MIKLNHNGAAGVLFALITSLVLLLVALVFGVWAFGSRQDYKNNTDAKITAAVSTAQTAQQRKDAAKEAEDLKNPFSTYSGPEAYGSIQVKFPNTWSAYVDDSSTNANSVVDGYFEPNIVPSISDQNSVFALRVQVVSQPYSQAITTYTNGGSGQKYSFSAYALPKVPKVVGIRVTGTQTNGQNSKNIDMVILPLRSDTLKIWTEGTQYSNDFNSNILPNLSFSP